MANDIVFVYIFGYFYVSVLAHFPISWVMKYLWEILQLQASEHIPRDTDSDKFPLEITSNTWQMFRQNLGLKHQ